MSVVAFNAYPAQWHLYRTYRLQESVETSAFGMFQRLKMVLHFNVKPLLSAETCQKKSTARNSNRCFELPRNCM